MNIEDIKNMDDINRLKEQYNNEIAHLSNELNALEEARRNKDLAVGEYERELESINRYTENEKNKLTELEKIERAYNNILTNLVALQKLTNYTPSDDYEKSEYEEELLARQNEINNNMDLLTPALLESIQEEVIKKLGIEEQEEVKDEKVEESSELTEEEIKSLEADAAKIIDEMNGLKEAVTKVDDLDDLERIKNELQIKAEELEKISSILTKSFSEEIEEMYAEDKESQELDIDNLSDQAINDINGKNTELVKLREDLEELELERKESIVRFKKIFNEERINQELNGPFTQEDYDKYFEYYMNQKIEEDERLKEINKKLKRVHNRIKKLEKEKKDVIKYSNEAFALEISYEEYIIIHKLLETGKDKRITKLFERKGLGDIVHKNGGRTKEEKEKLQEARDEIYKEVLEYKEKYDNLKSIEEIIDIIMDEDLGQIKQEEKPREMKLSPRAKNAIEENLGIIINGDVYISGDVNIVINGDGAKTLSFGSMTTGEDVPEADIDEERELPIDDNGSSSDNSVQSNEDELEDLPPVTEDNSLNNEEEQEEQVPFVPTVPNIPLLTGEVLEDEKTNTGSGNDNSPIDDVPYSDSPIIDEGNDGLSDEDEDNIISAEDFEDDDNKVVVPPVVDNDDDDENDLSDDDLEDDEDKDKGQEVPTGDDSSDSVEESEEKDDEKGQDSESEVKPKRGIREIIKDIRKEHEIGKKDGQRFRRSNLKVAESFKNEVQSGNYLYNIVHFVPGLVKAGVAFVSKLAAKLMLTEKVKDRMEDMKKNIDALPIEDLEVLWDEFRGNFITQEKYPQALTMVIQEKLREYAMGKVEAINIEITNAYRQVFTGKSMIEAIDKKLSEELSMEERDALLAQRKNILKAIVENIDLIRDKKIQGNKLLGDGLHGLDEDVRARDSKMNYVGLRFAKEYDLDKELEDKLTDFEKKENHGRAVGDDEEILEGFLGQEMLLEENTEVSNSVFGKRTTGKKQHSPLAEALNYSQDPFIRDLFTTIAFTTAAIGVINAINVHRAAQEQVANVDAANAQMTNHVHAKGQELVDQAPIFRKGMKAQTQEDVLAGSNSLEREALDHSAIDTGSWMGGKYSQYDAANHQAFEQFGDATRNGLSSISNRLSSGAIDQTEALRELVQLQQSTQSTLTSMLTKCYQTLQTYRGIKPQFDLDAPEKAMEFLINHSNSINDMNNAMLNSVEVGQELLGVSAEMVGELPSDLLTTLTACASSALLAYRVSSTMSAKYGDNKLHRNAVTDMFEDYMSEEEKEQEEEKAKSR